MPHAARGEALPWPMWPQPRCRLKFGRLLVPRRVRERSRNRSPCLRVTIAYTSNIIWIQEAERLRWTAGLVSSFPE
ncbi:hypothetical protein J4Q44_G00330070 [Coregonus suidteri]|uniref:Uncharacterized protein n=1 Tax=Coregonus suidteri TaxID=861788 RepID=A0AAN8KX13_9TELE